MVSEGGQLPSPFPKLTLGLVPPRQQAFVGEAERSFNAQEIPGGDQRCWNSLGHLSLYYGHHRSHTPPGTSLEKSYRAALAPPAKDNGHRTSMQNLYLEHVCY